MNGVYTADFPTVGALLKGNSASTAGSWCSGTMIGCSTFLTAAHCVCDGVGGNCQPGDPGAPNPAQFFVFLQHDGIYGVSGIAVHPSYTFPVADVAVLTLTGAVTGIRPTPLQLSGSPTFGTAGTIVGFGRSGNGSGDYGLKRSGSVTTADCTPESNLSSVCWDFDNPLGAPGSNSNTCNGDSGGPLFLGGACGTTIAGITSGGNSNECTPVDNSYDASVYNYRAYIQAQGGADLSQVACGATPQIGEAGTTVESATGTVSSGAPDATHSFTVPSGVAELRIAMNGVDDGGADFDLYVKVGSPPTTADFDCRANGANQVGFCRFPNPAAGDWHVLVHRYAGSGVYQVTATTLEAGAPGAAPGGACDDGNPCTTGDTCLASACVGSAAPDGTPCDDGSVCTTPDVCTGGACGGIGAPQANCALPSVGRASTFTIKDNGNDTRDALTWKWSKGPGSLAQLGTPTGATTYDLCVFDESGGLPTVALATRIPSGFNWRAAGRGFKYADRNASVAGVKAVTVKAAANGTATFSLKAKGSALPTPSLPLAQDPRVRVQLSNGSACWEGRFSTSTRNDAGAFVGKSD